MASARVGLTHHDVSLWLACVRRIAKLSHHIEGKPRSSSAPLRALKGESLRKAAAKRQKLDDEPAN
jgi:hypothetical protein